MYKIKIEVPEEANENEKSIAQDHECDSFVLLTFKDGQPDHRVYGGVRVSDIGKVIAQEDILMRAAKYADGIIYAGALNDSVRAVGAPTEETVEEEKNDE